MSDQFNNFTTTLEQDIHSQIVFYRNLLLGLPVSYVRLPHWFPARVQDRWSTGQREHCVLRGQTGRCVASQANARTNGFRPDG